MLFIYILTLQTFFMFACVKINSPITASNKIEGYPWKQLIHSGNGLSLRRDLPKSSKSYYRTKWVRHIKEEPFLAFQPTQDLWGVFPVFSLVTIVVTNSWKTNKQKILEKTYLWQTVQPVLRSTCGQSCSELLPSLPPTPFSSSLSNDKSDNWG